VGQKKIELIFEDCPTTPGIDTIGPALVRCPVEGPSAAWTSPALGYAPSVPWKLYRVVNVPPVVIWKTVLHGFSSLAPGGGIPAATEARPQLFIQPTPNPSRAGEAGDE
jgi:hypothetical protein